MLVSVFLSSVYTFAAASPLFHSLPHPLLYHIHSPERFISAHGLCLPDFDIERVHPLAVHAAGAYQSIDIEYRTPIEGPMRARIFTDRSAHSHFVIWSGERRIACGRLAVERGERHGTWALRVRTQVFPPPPGSDRVADLLFRPRRMPQPVFEALLLAQSIVVDADEQEEELHAYRQNLLLLRGPPPRPMF